MGGGTTHINIPMIKSKTLSPNFPSLSPPHPSSSLNFPVSANNTSALRQYCTGDSCAYCLRQIVNKSNNDLFGLVPSPSEVKTSFSALQNFLRGIRSSESELKRVLQAVGGYGRFEQAFRLLLSEPIIKRLVVSLSACKAVWDALMNNEMVRQLRESYTPPAHNQKTESCTGEKDALTCILSWLMEMTKAKVNELVQKFELLMNQIFQPPDRKKQAKENKEEMDDIVGSSFVLSVVILLIVVVASFHRA